MLRVHVKEGSERLKPCSRCLEDTKLGHGTCTLTLPAAVDTVKVFNIMKPGSTVPVFVKIREKASNLLWRLCEYLRIRSRTPLQQYASKGKMQTFPPAVLKACVSQPLPTSRLAQLILIDVAITWRSITQCSGASTPACWLEAENRTVCVENPESCSDGLLHTQHHTT